MRCRRCGFDSPPDSVYCCGCGVPLASPAAENPSDAEKPLETSGRAIASAYLAALAVVPLYIDISEGLSHSRFGPRMEWTLLYLPGVVAAVALGHSALRAIARSRGLLAGRRMAWMGTAMGYAALAIIAFVIYVPGEIYHRRMEKERPAIDMLSIVPGSIEEFQRRFPERRFPRDFAEFETVYRADYRFASQVQWFSRTGYSFEYTAKIAGDGKTVVGFALTAEPPPGSGLDHFYTDNTTMWRVRYERDKRATSGSPEWR